MKRFLTISAVMAGLLFAPSAANAYPVHPAAPPAHSCTATATSLATWATNINNAAAGTTQCLANGTYAGTPNIARSSALGAVTAASVSGYGAVIDGGILHNTGAVTYQGLDLRNTTSGPGTNGDCFVEAPGVTSAVAVKYSKVHACNRNGLVMKRPTCTPTPCVPASGYANNFTVDNNFLFDTGNVTTTGAVVALRTPNSAGVGKATVTNNDVTDFPDDFVLGWGNGHTVVSNIVHDVFPSGTNHNDFYQTYKVVPADTAMGLPVTNLLIERNRTRNFTGVNAHFVASSGTHSTWTIRSNEIANVGASSHSIILGDSTLPSESVTGATVSGNTFYQSGHVEFNNASTGTLSNNIFYACTETGPWTIGTGAVTVTNNTGPDVPGPPGAPNCTATGTNAANRNPLFVNPLGGDFHLQAASLERESGTGTLGGLDIDDGARVVGIINRGADE